jgi:hypothetical protein
MCTSYFEQILPEKKSCAELTLNSLILPAFVHYSHKYKYKFFIKQYTENNSTKKAKQCQKDINIKLLHVSIYWFMFYMLGTGEGSQGSEELLGVSLGDR